MRGCWGPALGLCSRMALEEAGVVAANTASMLCTHRHVQRQQRLWTSCNSIGDGRLYTKGHDVSDITVPCAERTSGWLPI